MNKPKYTVPGHRCDHPDCPHCDNRGIRNMTKQQLEEAQRISNANFIKWLKGQGIYNNRRWFRIK